MNRATLYECLWLAVWLTVAGLTLALAVGCGSAPSPSARVTVEQGATVHTVDASPKTTANYDMSETQRASLRDTFLMLLRAAFGGLLIGIGLPELNAPWWARVACIVGGLALIVSPLF